MKKIILIILLIIPALINSQIKSGIELTPFSLKGTEKLKIINSTEVEGNFFIFYQYHENGKTRYVVRKCSEDLNTIKEEDFTNELGFAFELGTLENIYNIGNRIVIIFKRVNENGQFEYYYSELNKESLNFSKSINFLSTNIDERNKNIFDGLNLVKSKYNNSFLVYYEYHKIRGAKRINIVSHVFDFNFKNIWNKEISIEEKPKDFKICGSYLDKSDNANYLMLKRNVKEKKTSALIYSIENNDSEANNFELSGVINEHYIQNMKLVETKNNELKIIGFYSDNFIERDLIKGVFYSEINLNNKSVENNNLEDLVSLYPYIKKGMFDQDIELYGIGKKTHLKYYDLDKILLRDDGGFIIVSENSDHNISTPYHAYRNIMSISISPKGKMENLNKVPKNQSSEYGFDEQYMSYAFGFNGKNLCFIFNENKHNYKRDLKTKLPKALPTIRKDYVLSVVCFNNENGSESREILSEGFKEHKVIFRPSYYIQITNNTILINGRINDTSLYFLVKLNQ